MRTHIGRRAVVLGLAVAVLAGAGPNDMATALRPGPAPRAEPPAMPGPSVSPPQTTSGITFSVMSVNATVTANFADSGGPAERVEGQLQVMGRFARVDGASDDSAVFPWRLIITSAMDSRERELVDRKHEDRRDQAWNRTMLGQHFYQALANDRNDQLIVQDFLRGLKARPDRIASVRGRAEAVVGGKVIRKPIELRVMEEGIQVTPGLVLTITEAGITKGRSVIDFEVRTRRYRDRSEGEPGYEPVFAGLALKDEQGEVLLVLRNGQDVETRDEYLFLAKDQGLSKEYLERARSAEAWVVDQVRPVVFEFEVRGLDAGPG